MENPFVLLLSLFVLYAPLALIAFVLGFFALARLGPMLAARTK